MRDECIISPYGSADRWWDVVKDAVAWPLKEQICWYIGPVLNIICWAMMNSISWRCKMNELVCWLLLHFGNSRARYVLHYYLTVWYTFLMLLAQTCHVKLQIYWRELKQIVLESMLSAIHSYHMLWLTVLLPPPHFRNPREGYVLHHSTEILFVHDVTVPSVPYVNFSAWRNIWSKFVL